MSEDDDVLNRYALIKKDIAEATNKVLNAHGTSWATIKEMEDTIGQAYNAGVYQALVGGGVQVEEKTIYVNGKPFGTKKRVSYRPNANINHNVVKGKMF